MIITDKNIDERKINQLIGESISFNLKNPKSAGGPGLFLKSCVSKGSGEELIRTNSKCNLEKRTAGILLHTNISNKRTLIALPEKEIIEIKIIRGKEDIDPFFLSPMWIMLKLGVSILKARYFRMNCSEYSIDLMKLSLKSFYYEMDFVANGYLFESQLKFLEDLQYGEKLKVKRNDSDL